MTWQTISIGSADTERLGRLVGKYLRGGEVVELKSDLGGGKTTFVKGMAVGLGAKTKVTSPTFTLSQLYKGKDKLTIHHYDFYRLKDAGVMADQIKESIDNPEAITIVEWGASVKKVLPDWRLSVTLEPDPQDPNHRRITFNYQPTMAKLVQRVRGDWES